MKERKGEHKIVDFSPFLPSPFLRFSGSKPTNVSSSFFLTLLSAAFLILAFPRFSLWPLAWVAWVPGLVLLSRLKTARSAFGCSYLIGVLFFLVSVEWLRHVSYFGWWFAAFVHAAYFGCFGWASYFSLRKNNWFFQILGIPSMWVVLEWIRTEIPVWGFGWNLLAYSQADLTPVAQIASLIGAYGVSWMVMIGNLFVFFCFRFLKTRRLSEMKPAFAAFTILTVLIGTSLFYNRSFDRNLNPPAPFRVAVVQPNIPQSAKWQPMERSRILELHEQLTRLVSFDRPDLIVWPEAAFPGYFNRDPDRTQVIQLQTELGIPILLGGLYWAENDSGAGRAYNSVYLLNQNSDSTDRYDKIRLVPFGEFVPWPGFFGWLGLDRVAYSFGVGDFKSGETIKIFSARGVPPFSALICFEDTFPSLARQAVQEGAGFLVVTTNDAWFSKSAAPYQHLQASQFRAIEHRVPLVRAANTGVSAWIDRQGRVVDRVKNPNGNDIFISGGLTRPVRTGGGKTLYSEFGFYFPHACLMFVVAAVVLQRVILKRQ